MGEAGLPGGPVGLYRQPSRPRGWSGQRDSNPRHQAWEACTLPAELCPLNAQRVCIINFSKYVKTFYDVWPDAPDAWRPPDESSAQNHFVILSGAQDLLCSRSYEILRSLHSLRMTGLGTCAKVSAYDGKALTGTSIRCQAEPREPSVGLGVVQFCPFAPSGFLVHLPPAAKLSPVPFA
jgi:hypothetical protein